jgi:acetyl-CoA C-acetyltransferase
MNSQINEVYIVDAVRIPRARVRIKDDGQSSESAYSGLKPIELLEPLFHALAERNQLDTQKVEDVLLGCATQTQEQGANLAKIASLYAGWSDQVSGVTLNRFCCSGLDAINTGAAKIMAGMESLLVVGGVEQLSCVPMFADNGPWYSDKKVMKKTRFLHMGLAADLISNQNNYSRHILDELSVGSHQKALHAQQQGYFNKSLIPVVDSKGETRLSEDDGIRENISLEGLKDLPARFSAFVGTGQSIIEQVYPGGELVAQHSAANSPALVDGASLVLLASKEKCDELNLKPRARIRHFANASDEPVKMLTGHIRAMDKMFNATGLSPGDIDLWEVNESFAASVLNFQEHFSIDDTKLNVNGSAIALGHPLGATGGNLMGMLLDELERRQLKRGVVAICGGAGVGVVTMIECI